MPSYRVVAVYEISKRVRRSHAIDAENMAEAAAALVEPDIPYIGERTEHEEIRILEAAITDVGYAPGADWKAISAFELAVHGSVTAEEARRANVGAEDAIAAAVDAERGRRK